MFQKLYRHLEEISSSLHETRTGVSNQLGETIIGQFETMNATLHRMQNQLETGNHASDSAELRGQRPARQSILWAVLAAVMIPLLIFMAMTVAHINRSLSEPVVNRTLITPWMVPIPVVSPDPAGSRLAVEQHLATLDSLITEQQEAIVELRKLNITAVVTMQRIRRHFAVAR